MARRPAGVRGTSTEWGRRCRTSYLGECYRPSARRLSSSAGSSSTTTGCLYPQPPPAAAAVCTGPSRVPCTPSGRTPHPPSRAAPSCLSPSAPSTHTSGSDTHTTHSRTTSGRRSSPSCSVTSCGACRLLSRGTRPSPHGRRRSPAGLWPSAPSGARTVSLSAKPAATTRRLRPTPIRAKAARRRAGEEAVLWHHRASRSSSREPPYSQPSHPSTRAAGGDRQPPNTREAGSWRSALP
mmetsp:Transcript_21544/g.61357  ORF Transcript_21544/g.61357 Transcript_21544/m.61357 type:complete len:238 (-) Transcript_21544:189-902(-)